jgi:hypothetical protein
MGDLSEFEHQNINFKLLLKNLKILVELYLKSRKSGV